MRPALALFALALVIHSAWALTIATPVDWDPAYYTVVARHLAAGDGAFTDVVWNLLAPPAHLPTVADLHWMPLPSRVLVPGLWLWPAHGEQLVTVLIAACWAPLAWASARRLGASPQVAILAGLLAATGGGYARFLSTPDSIAIYGLIGGGSVLAALSRRWAVVASLGALAALTRGDGFLLSLALALAAPGAWRWAVASSGPLAAGLWALRNLWLAGPDALALRRAAAGALTPADLVRGGFTPATLLQRLQALLTEAPGLLLVALLLGVFLLPWPGLIAAWRARRRPVLRAATVYALAVPVIGLLAAPAVARSGTPFRSWAALFPLGCALAAVGLDRWGTWTAARRGYPRLFVPAVVALGFAVGTVFLGRSASRAMPADTLDCASLGGGVVLAADPLPLAARCRVSAVVLPVDADPAMLAELVQRYGVRVAVLAPDADPRRGLARAGDLPRLLPGWVLSGRLARPPG